MLCLADATVPQKKKKKNSPQRSYGRGALANPTHLMWGQNNKNLKHTKTPPTDIHVVCKQPKLQYGIERVLSLKSLLVRPCL